ncbi:hypothetical protein C0993_011766 [Termitomyces sp. T159_Od127]|nr:hypothetical protein C0993_011766 [Termitomyces sp. T159_Od127]
MATILYDDDSPNLLYNARTQLGVDTKYLGGTATKVFLESSADALSISFIGTSAMIYGTLGPESGFSSEPLQVTLDDEIQEGVQLHIDNLDILRVLYQSPSSTRSGTSLNLDYAAVTAGKNTPLVGETLIIDDHDPSVVYDGNWGPSTNFMLFDDSGPRFAYANTSHQTSSKEASATFSFNGTSAALFGAGTGLHIDFDIEVDGETVPRPIMVFANSTNWRWYQCSGLLPTNHTVKITYSGGNSNATFNLDYLTYTPSFVSLAEKEGLQGSLNNQSSGVSLGTLLGAIIGPVLFVIIIVILLFMRKKKLGLWSSRQSNTGRDPSQLPAYTASVAVPAPSNVTQPFFSRLWRRPQPGIVEAFPPDYSPSSSRQSLVQHKPMLPVWNAYGEQQEASHQADAGSMNDTTANLRLGVLEQMIRTLQQEIEETRRDRSGAQNEAPVRQLVGNRDDYSMMSTIVA